MILLSTSILLLALPLTFTYDRRANFRTRRMMMMQPPQRTNVAPFLIRVPHPQVGPTNSLFAHTVAWRTKLPQVKSNMDETSRQQQEQQQSSQQDQQQPLSDPEIQQFQSQDTNGQVIFGFNSPDQMRIETRNPDGTVHGTYSYLDPYGQVIKRQYWDTGSGFHVTSNTYPLNGPAPGGPGGQQAVPYTPEVQAARDLHFQLYQQALSSMLPAHGPQDTLEGKENDTAVESPNSNHTTPNEEQEAPIEFRRLNDSTAVPSSQPSPSTRPPISSTHSTLSPTTTSPKVGDRSKQPTTKEPRPVFVAQDRVHEVNEKNSVQTDADDAEAASDPETQNGSIVIENPEYLRISWTTDSKKYRLNLYNGTENSANSTSKVQIRHDVPNMYNITKFTVRGRPK